MWLYNLYRERRRVSPSARLDVSVRKEDDCVVGAAFLPQCCMQTQAAHNCTCRRTQQRVGELCQA